MMPRLFFLFLILLTVAMPSSVFAQFSSLENNPKPMELSELQNIKKENRFVAENVMPLDIRFDAVKEAALSYGARGGLAWRTYHIRKELEQRSRYLDKVFDFRQLLIPAASGLLIEPPIISEAQDAMLIESNGLNAAVADRVFNIGRNSRIVSAPRTWRVYLERQWGEVSMPPDILRPATKEEREIWVSLVKKGWNKGVEQADEIFQADLNKLVADYQGMIRYKTLLVQGMVSPPMALQVDRGVTGGGKEMRVGDRAVTITGLPELQPRYETWQPANR
ncbi:MAG: type IV secretion system DotC family protein [Alphaproteobacteria bacterium]|nr:type IV secretion system DotC family protein [Alphaproteobacteria bacterium]